MEIIHKCCHCQQDFELEPIYDRAGNKYCSTKCFQDGDRPIAGIDFKIAIEEVPSPCNGNCIMKLGVCQGCGRDRWEIGNWRDMGDASRILARAAAKKRLRILKNENN